MKFFTIPALLASALLSALVVIPFLPAAKDRPTYFVLEAEVRSSVASYLQVYFDSGTGYEEAESYRVPLARSDTAELYRLPLPRGTLQALRLDPGEREGVVTIESLRVVMPYGRGRTLPLSELKPVQQIETVREKQGHVEIVTSPGANDPQLQLTLAPPLVLQTTKWDRLSGFWTRVGGMFAIMGLLLFALDRAPRLQAWFVARARSLATRPRRGIGIVAAIAVVASTYPVVFLGKSHVSPNLGTPLLYEAFPTLPGYTASETTDVKGSDIGAIMWSHVPLSMMQHRALAQGELPLWNRYNSGGTPLLGQGQSMLGDPVHLFVILANGASWAWDLKYLIAKWLFAAGLGLVVLAVLEPGGKRLIHEGQRGSFVAPNVLLSALLVSAVAPFIGFFLFRVNHPAFFSLCYAPWPLYCWLRVSAAENRRATGAWVGGLLVANFAVMNSGTTKEAYMLLVTMNFAGAVTLLASAAPWRAKLVKLALLAWAGALFVLLTIPIWSTFLHSLKNAYTGYNSASAFQIQPSLLLGLFDEIFYRPLTPGERVFGPSLNFLLLLGVLYFLVTLRTHLANRTVIALAAASLLPLSLAFGLVPPTWIMRVPFLGNIAHIDNTFSCALIVLWSVLAGVGFARAVERLRSPEGRGDLVIAGLLLFALVFGWIAFRQVAHRPIYGPSFTVNPPGESLATSRFLWRYLASLLFGVLLISFAARRASVRGALTPALALSLACGALLLCWRHGQHAMSVGFETHTFRPTARAPFHAESAAVEFVRARQAQEPSRGHGLHSTFFPGWTGVYELESIHGPDALVNPFLRAMMGILPGAERIWDWRIHLTPENVAAARPYFDALNIRFYFDLQRGRNVLGNTLALRKAADLDVYESTTAWPRAFFTDRVLPYEGVADFVRSIGAGDGRPFAAVQRGDLTAASPLGKMSADLATRTVTPATNYHLTENTTSFTIQASGPGVLVLNEVFWPGDARAFVDGRKTSILRLNQAFMGVMIDRPGEHRVEFRYLPKNFPRNLQICAVAAALLALSAYFVMRKPRTP